MPVQAADESPEVAPFIVAHCGAREYIGEVCVMANKLPNAEAHVADIDKPCFFAPN